MTLDAQIAELAEHIAAGGSNVVFTGAGISTESGIPDFRSKGGLWERFRPVYFDEFLASREARIEYWRRKSELYHDFVNARPNAAHLALARLYEQGLLEAVITQNIDNLHQDAGLPPDAVIELHGNARRVRCLHCGDLYPIDDVQARLEAGDLAPECRCGGYLKPDTISFGQAMPLDAVERAVAVSQRCDLFLVIGSTLLVQPAALMPRYAQDAGAFLAIINLSSTPYDSDCDLLIQAEAGATMTQLLDHLSGISSEKNISA